MKHTTRKRYPFANAWFFPAAALYGAFAVLTWSLTTAGYTDCLPGLCTPIGHAHEMLFGYAFAVVAGFLLGPQPIVITMTLFMLWVSARVAFLFWPGSWTSAALVAGFAIGVAVIVIPRFASAAKKWRNQSVVWIVGGLASAGVAMTLAYGRWNVDAIRTGSIILFAALMFFMGGRIMAPAIAGHITRQGVRLDARVQPSLEGTVLLLLLAALVGAGLPGDATNEFTGLVLVLAGLLIAIRLARWRLWLCADRPDLLMLAVGYAWLAAGVGVLGFSQLGALSQSAAIHSLMVGALGTLTITVMARTRLLYKFRDANVAPEAHLAAVLISGAAIARIIWNYSPAPLGIDLLLVSAGLWSTSCLVVFRTLLRTLKSEDRGHNASGSRPADTSAGTI